MAFSGDRTPRASGQTGRGPGSQRGSLVRRGQRSAVAVRRDDPSRLIGDSPSGAEASSGPPDTCRSTGRGVEKATGIPPAGTPGNRGFRIHTYRSFTLRSTSTTTATLPHVSSTLGKRSIKSTGRRSCSLRCAGCDFRGFVRFAHETTPPSVHVAPVSRSFTSVVGPRSRRSLTIDRNGICLPFSESRASHFVRDAFPATRLVPVG